MRIPNAAHGPSSSVVRSLSQLTYLVLNVEVPGCGAPPSDSSLGETAGFERRGADASREIPHNRLRKAPYSPLCTRVLS